MQIFGQRTRFLFAVLATSIAIFLIQIACLNNFTYAADSARCTIPDPDLDYVDDYFSRYSRSNTNNHAPHSTFTLHYNCSGRTGAIKLSLREGEPQSHPYYTDILYTRLGDGASEFQNAIMVVSEQYTRIRIAYCDGMDAKKESAPNPGDPGAMRYLLLCPNLQSGNHYMSILFSHGGCYINTTTRDPSTRAITLQLFNGDLCEWRLRYTSIPVYIDLMKQLVSSR